MLQLVILKQLIQGNVYAISLFYLNESTFLLIMIYLTHRASFHSGLTASLTLGNDKLKVLHFLTMFIV